MLQVKHKRWKLYQKSLQLAKEVYGITEHFPDSERAVLVYTLRRLTVFLCQEIAASATKKGKKQRRSLDLCLTHCVSLDAQLELAIAVHLVTEEKVREAATLLNVIYENLTQLVQQT